MAASGWHTQRAHWHIAHGRYAGPYRLTLHVGLRPAATIALAVDLQTTHASARSRCSSRGALVRPMGSDTFATPVHGERVELHAQPLSLAPVHFAPVHFLFTVIFFHKFWKNERGRRLINTGRACTQAAGLSATHVGARGTAGDGGARPE